MAHVHLYLTLGCAVLKVVISTVRVADALDLVASHALYFLSIVNVLGMVVCREVDNWSVGIYALVLLACNHLAPYCVLLVDYWELDRRSSVVTQVLIAVEYHLCVELRDAFVLRTELHFHLLCCFRLDSWHISCLTNENTLAFVFAVDSNLIIALLCCA